MARMVTAEKVAVVTPPAVLKIAVAVGSPSTFNVTLPVGATVPTGGEPTARLTVTVKGVPAEGLVVDGTTVSDVVLGSAVTTTGCELADA